MFEFFRGWKRKAGVATLVMACTLAAAWVRSLFVTDFVNTGFIGAVINAPQRHHQQPQ